MSGKRATEDQREKALALLATGVSQRRTAKKVGVSRSTVNKWANENPGELDHLRTLKKAEFIRDAWEIILLANQRVKESINRSSAGQAATVAGIYYDKQALAAGDNTQNVGGEVTIKVKLPEGLEANANSTEKANDG